MPIIENYSQLFSTCIRAVVDCSRGAVCLMYQVVNAVFVRGSSNAVASPCVVLCFITVLSPTRLELEGVGFSLSVL